MVELSNKLLCELAEKLSVLYNTEKSKLSYGANVIDELHAGENAHSRILRLLLQYSNGYGYPVYSSFLKLLNRFCKEMRTDIINPDFSNEENRIDVLVKERNVLPPYAIIIENKVCEATDQDRQIERYVEKIKSSIFNQKNIYVVYLTSTGDKRVSDISLTEKAKELLNVSNESRGRFIELNYKYDILPWMEYDVLPNIAIREELLISSVRLYIDYLKGIFGMRVNEEPIINKIQETMKEKLKIESLDDCLKLYNEAGNFRNYCFDLLMREISRCLEENLFIPLETAFPGAKVDRIPTELRIDRLSFIVELPQWKKCQFKLETDHDYGITLKNPDNPISEDVRKSLREIYSNGYKDNKWWPVYRALNKDIATDKTLEFWKDVEKGRVKEHFKNWIEKALKETEKFDM